MPHKRLEDLVINRVALCRRGMNPEAHMVLWKAEVPPSPQWPDLEYVAKKDYSTEQRIAFAKKGWAIPVRNDKGEITNGAYPIADKGDLTDAIQAFGRAGDKATTKAHIIKSAKRLGASDQLPKDWSTTKAEVAKVGRKMSGDRISRLRQAHASIGAILDEADPPEETEKGDDMPEFDPKDLPEEARKYVEGLEAAKKTAEEEVTALKAKAEAQPPKPDESPEETHLKALEKSERAEDKATAAMLRKALEDSKLAKAESDRLSTEKAESEARDRLAKAAESVPGFAGDALTERAKAFRDVEKASPDAAKFMEEALRAAGEHIRKSKVFTVVGESGADADSSAKAAIDAKVAELQKADPKLTYEQAFTQVAAAGSELRKAWDDERKQSERGA